MSQIDLSTLPGQELRQLLDSARQRGHAAQSYEILQEMESRRVHGEPIVSKRSRKRRPRQSRMIVLDLGDPLDMPEPVDELVSPDEPPLTLGAPPLSPRSPPPSAPVRQRWAHWATLCFALGLGGGVAAGWWAADGRDWDPLSLVRATPARQAAAHRPLPVTVAEASPPQAPADPPQPSVVAAAAPDAPSAIAPAVDNVGPMLAAVAAPAPGNGETAGPLARPASVQDAQEVTPASAARPAKASETDACGAEPTPADRTICAAPRLRRLQLELQQTYASALEAHQDRALLRQRELAWREARNALTDPRQLAGLYARRISQLKAATLDAERQRASAAHGLRRQASTVRGGLGG